MVSLVGTRDLDQQLTSRMQVCGAPVLLVRPRAHGPLPYGETYLTVLYFLVERTVLVVQASGCCRPDSPRWV